MSVKLLGGVNHLAIYRMGLALVNLHDAGLVAGDAYYNTLANLTRVTFFTHIVQTFLAAP